MIKPPKIVIRCPNWLGDLMMSTAFVSAVLQLFPDSSVDLIVKSGFEKLPLPHRGELIPFDKEKMNAGVFGKTLESKEYDLFFVLPPSFSSAWMAWKSGVKRRIGYAQNMRGWLFNPSIKYTQTHRSNHLVQEYLDLLESGLKSEDYLPKLEINQEWSNLPENTISFDLPEKFLIMAPGAIYGPAKQWPVEYFQKTAELLEKENISTIVMGTAADALSGDEIVKNCKIGMNLCGKTSLTQLITLMHESSFLISNDSGSMHIMTALRKPQLAIFGSTSVVWTGPLNPKATVMKESIDCSPCYKRECPFGHYDCLKRVTPESVVKAVLKRWE